MNWQASAGQFCLVSHGHIEEGWPPLEINDRPSITMKVSAEASSWLEEQSRGLGLRTCEIQSKSANWKSSSGEGMQVRVLALLLKILTTKKRKSS